MTDWIEYIRRTMPQATITDPASQAHLAAAQNALGQPIPADLSELLVATNGLRGEYELQLIWPVERVVADNTLFRSHPQFVELYMPFDPLLFFGDAGNGDMFALLAEIDRPDVFAWNHENDSRSWIAPNVAKFLEWWVAGKIVV